MLDVAPVATDIDVTYEDAPRIVIWEMTRACALACKHCRADAIPYRNPGELDTEEAYDLVDAVVDCGRPIFVLTGGDPLMRPDVYSIVEYGTRKGLRMAVSPSATGRLTPVTLAKLSAAGCRRISLSIDGPDAMTHDVFRGVKGSFDRTLAAAKAAVDLGIEVQINTTIARHNYRHIEEMAELLPPLGAVLWSVFFLVPTGRAQREQCLDAAEHEAVFAQLFDIWLRSPFDVKTTEAPHYRRYVTQRLAEMAPEDRPEKTRGPALRFPAIGDGKGFVFISHLGEVCPSGFLPMVVGNVRSERLIDVYRDHPVMQRLRRPDTFSGKCGVCEFNRLCGGSRSRAYAFTGDPFAAEPCCSYLPAAVRAAQRAPQETTP
ncbi:MAG TPA: TIGR04053 family radical SAM/SPASM domain-containing protein [Candidatus Dormibacteraeota bacterium]|nr:TIGR04053 family radical SAM/SPASM domain-containing protein [Candidatus Dormibacteraeota bacterium]